jgi:hypothetical protein
MFDRQEFSQQRQRSTLKSLKSYTRRSSELRQIGQFEE